MPKNFRLLKGIVITLGVLIVVMVVVIIVTAVMKYNEQKNAEAALVEKYRAANPQNVALSGSPFEIDLQLQAGQQIISAESGNNGVLLRIGTNGVTDKIILVDYSGKITGTINIK